MNFELEEKPFKRTLFSETEIMTIDVKKSWGNLSKLCEIPQKFCKAIVLLQACPSSNAFIERIFSNIIFVYSKI